MRFDQLPLLPGATPIGGHFAEIRRNRLAFFDRVAREGADIGRVRILHTQSVYVASASTVREVLVEKVKSFEKSPVLRAVLYPLAGEGLFTSDGELWRRQRKLMAPLFQHERLAEYAVAMAECAVATAGSWNDGDVVDVARETTRITMNIAGRTLFGAETLSESDDLGAALTYALRWADEEASSVPLLLQMRAYFWAEALARVAPERFADDAERLLTRLRQPILWPSERSRELEAAVKTLDDKVNRMIAERRLAGLSRPDLLSRLLAARDDEGSQMSDKQVRDEILTLFVAGHETTASGLAWALYLLARHPDAYRRVRDEADAIGGDAPGFGDLARLPYTLSVFKEALRLYPPVYMFGRRATADVELAGYEVPRGTIIMLSPYAIHRRAEVWPDPQRFDPDRFTPEAEEARPRQAFLAFSAGQRTCIGNLFSLIEGPIVLATLLRRADLELVSREPIEPQAAGTLRPKGGVPMRVRLRR